jgi:predicted nuclease of predicted toxin-antitoxin system
VNLLADENVDRAVVERLRQDGHDVAYVVELFPSIPDEDVLRQANDRNALLVTADRDFGELVFRQRRLHRGVVLLRLAGLSNATKAEIVAEVCRDRASEMFQAFSVIFQPGFAEARASLERLLQGMGASSTGPDA